jgi:hypothetical protein
VTGSPLRPPSPPPRAPLPQGLQQFLLTTLGEAGLRRLARGIDLAAGALHGALLGGALPRLSLAVFALGEMRGLAAAAWGLQQLGLQVRAAAAAPRAAPRPRVPAASAPSAALS